MQTTDSIFPRRTKEAGWMHTIIISCKRKGSWRYAGHSNNHKWEKVSSIKSKYYQFRRIRPK